MTGCTHSLSISQLLHETCVLLDAGNVERLHLRANTVDEVIIRYRRGRNGTFDIRVVCSKSESDGGPTSHIYAVTHR